MTRRGVLFLLLLGVTLTGCSSDSGPVTYSSPAMNVRAATLLPRDVAALPTMDEGGFRDLLDQLKGTPVVVNVWGSWCEPCKAEIPLMTAAARTHQDVQFIGVDIQDSRDGATSFISRYRIPYPSVFDPPAAIKTSFGSLGQPDTYFFDRGGTMAARYDGQIPADTLDADIAKISG